jgi:hypothetical protein
MEINRLWLLINPRVDRGRADSSPWTATFSDDYDNCVSGVFTTAEAGRQFCELHAPNCRADSFAPLDALELLIQTAQTGSAFFAIDPVSPSAFGSLNFNGLLAGLLEQGVEFSAHEPLS